MRTAGGCVSVTVAIKHVSGPSASLARVRAGCECFAGLRHAGIWMRIEFTTGYLLITAVARVAWRGRIWSLYSTIATALFLIHSEVFFVLSGGSTRPEQFSMQVVGSCIVFACTLGGTFVLRNWAPAS